MIELMIVVAIIGILASVAIPSFLKFIKKSKSTEAPVHLRSLINGAVAWYNDEHADTNGKPMRAHFPHSSSPTTLPPAFPSSDQTISPATSPCISGNPMYSKNTALWENAPWTFLKFSITKAHYYQYVAVSQSRSNPFGSGGFQGDDRFVAAAAGDLDCDSTYAFFRMGVGQHNTLADPTSLHIGEMIVENGLE